MKISALLNEGLSDIVYHFTSMSNAIKILETNTFALSSAMAKSAEQGYVKNHYFYLSTTRTKNGHYGHNNYEMVCFVLDGAKLRQNYAGEAVDYWEARKDNRSEAEDRLWTAQAYIKDASKYITRLDVFMEEKRIEDRAIGPLTELVNAANKTGVDVEFYATTQDFLTSKRAINAQDYLNKHAKEGPTPKQYTRTFQNDMLKYIDAVKGINLDNEKVSKLIYNIKYYPQDTFRMLKADAHNEATTDDMREFTQLALKLKLRNLQQVADYLNAKYKPTR